MALPNNIPDDLLKQIKEDYVQIGRGMRLNPQTLAGDIKGVPPLEPLLLFSQRMKMTSTIDEMKEL